MPKLILVYNSDSGPFNAVFSSIHKVLSPSTYACSLCRLSHGMTGALKIWRCFLENLSIPVRSYHHDQFQEAFPDNSCLTFPVILLQSDSGLYELLSTEKIGEADNVMTLIALLEDALAANAFRIV